MGVMNLIVTIVSAVYGLFIFIVSAILVYQVQDTWTTIAPGFYSSITEYKVTIACAALGLIGSLLQFLLGTMAAASALFAQQTKPVEKGAVMGVHIFLFVVFLVTLILGIYEGVASAGVLISSSNATKRYGIGAVFISFVGIDCLACIILALFCQLCV